MFEEVIGFVHFSLVDETLFRKFEGINVLVTFEESSVKELKKLYKFA